ncbi:DnaJ domain-domain-containing protein [Aspergillus taichungensis]|uniref:DnaJ domain-domain-containing protein n=1 Tax=Aspergillus taichungensis TaxID=482145 RepID=A0A2J5HNP8_9EURO|nr:DnaJ domain-domain-containing protein [Aspergillus taichungensis]
MLFPRVRISFIRLRRPSPLDSLRATSPSSSSIPTSYAASFSTSSPCRAASREPTLYEVLDVPITATSAEIKKQFYSLSLRHHPDRNRTDPHATNRFSRISSAYNILGNAAKRSTYDREHGIAAHLASTRSTAHPGQHPMGSHSSHSANLHNHGGSYAGSRPASGLSKRRGAFRGPPPSFYAHGGYGNRKPPPPPHGGSAGFAGAGAGAGGTGRTSRSDEDHTDFINRNPVNHFNARGHYRTQTAEDKRRQQRQSRARSAAVREHEMGSSADFAFRFVVVCGILVGAGALAGWPGASGKPGAGAGGSGKLGAGERRDGGSAG